MNMNEYMKLSEVTEKKFPEGLILTETQRKAIEAALWWSKCAGDLVDKVKRDIIYNKPIELNAFEQEVVDACLLEVPNQLDSFQTEMLHHLLGAVTEPIEAFTAFGEYLMGKSELDVINLKEEGGDSQWYWAGVYRLLNTTFEAEAERNINKLKARYGDKFSEAAALSRDLSTERSVLEQ